MKSVKPQFSREHPHLGVLLHRARRLLDEEIVSALSAAGFHNLRIGHEAVFSFMPARGTRLTELARRARITKQSMGELVRELETLGYVERAADPADGRAQIIRFTAMGERANAVGIKTNVNFERKWGRAVGEKQMADLRSALETMTRRPDKSEG